MKNLKAMNYSEILSSFDVGQGKTSDIPAYASFEDGTLIYESHVAEVTQEWVKAFALMTLRNNVKDQPEERKARLFKAFNEGRLSLNHNVNSEKKTVKQPLDGHYLTSTEYLENCVKLAVSVDTVQAIFDLVKGVTTSQTKQELLDTLQSVSDLIITQEQLQTAAIMEEKEQNFNKVKTELNGYATLKFISETKIMASVKPADLDNVINTFTSLGYVQTDVKFDQSTMTMQLYVDNEKV